MVVYSFYIFDRHAECIYKKKYQQSSLSQRAARPLSSASTAPSQAPSRPTSSSNNPNSQPQAQEQGRDKLDGERPDPDGPGREALSAEDDAKLVFGAIYSLRGLVRKLGGEDDNFVSYRTSHYKLHYYETPTSLKFVMVTDTRTNNLRIVLHQIYVSLYVEYVVKNPLSPIEHPGGVGVNCEMFEYGLDQFIVRSSF